MSARDNAAGLDPGVWRIAGVVMLGPLMTNLDSTIVNVSLASLSRELAAPLPVIQWVASGYLLALALALPLSGWLVDRCGARRVYLGCFAAFTLASLLCGLAPSAASLIAARVLQGMAGGLLAPMAQMTIARVAGGHMARVMGLMVVPVLIGPILGPVLGGLILQHASWRWVFFVNLPIGILATALAARVLPCDAAAMRRPFDLRGFLLLSPGLAVLLYGLGELGAGPARRPAGLAELAASAALLFAFVVVALRRGERALIDLRLFRDRTFSAAAATQFLANAVMLGGQVLVPLFLLTVRGLTPGGTGWLLAPFGLGALCSFPLMGRLTERHGPRAVTVAGGSLALLGTVPFAAPHATALALPAVCLALFVRGVGTGATTLPAVASAYAATPRDAIPVATTALNIAQRLGGPMATSVLALCLGAGGVDAPGRAPAAFQAAFLLLCALHALVILAGCLLPATLEPAASGASPHAPALPRGRSAAFPARPRHASG